MAWESKVWKQSTKPSLWEDIISVLNEGILSKIWILLEKRSWHRKCFLAFIYKTSNHPDTEAPLSSPSLQTTRSFVSVAFSNAKLSCFKMNFSMNSSPCLNKQAHLATLADLGNNANRSIFVILQPNHKGWHQKLYSPVTTIGRDEIELYLENISECLDMGWMSQEAVSSTSNVGWTN